MFCAFFFFNDPATTEIYTLSLHDALPICQPDGGWYSELVYRATIVDLQACSRRHYRSGEGLAILVQPQSDRKSTRLNSSHSQISYAVFCLKKQTAHVCGRTNLNILRRGRV